MPIARPAAVSVSQVVGTPISARPPSATIGTSSTGSHASSRSAKARPHDVGRDRGFAHWCASRLRPISRSCSAGVGRQLRHRAGVHDAAVVHHRHRVADLAGHGEILLHQQDGGVGALELARWPRSWT